MKSVKISLQDILEVLLAMEANGTQDLLIFDHEGIPALADADEPENRIQFQTFDDTEEANDSDSIH